MKIEVGKKYRTRGGEAAVVNGFGEGPPGTREMVDINFPYHGNTASLEGVTWSPEGRHCTRDDCQNDLIAEIPDEPEAEKCYRVTTRNSEIPEPMTLAEAQELAESDALASPGRVCDVVRVIKSCTASVRVEWES